MPPPKDSRSDGELVAAINAGDAGAFDALYYRYRDWVASLARRFTGDADDALDVLQETFVYVARKVPHLALTAKMTTFLYPVVRNLSLTHRRKPALASEESLAALEAPLQSEPSADQADLATALARLPEGQRETLLLRFVDGFSLAEIAQALDVPLGTVKSRLHNSLTALRKDEQTRPYFEE